MLMRSDGLGPLLAVTPAADAWTRGMLVVDNARLGDVVDELGRYRTGTWAWTKTWLTCASPAASRCTTPRRSTPCCRPCRCGSSGTRRGG